MNPLRLPSIFKNKGPRAFDYKPRYYDESKERLDLLKKESSELTENERRAVFQSRLRERWGESNRSAAGRSQAIVRRIVILIGLSIAVYVLLN